MLQELRSNFAALTSQIGTRRFLVVSRTKPPANPERYFPDESSIEWLSDLCSFDDLGKPKRADLGFVFDQLEHMGKAEGAHLLSRLRDCHCRVVLLHYTGKEFSNRELLALGFIEQGCLSTGGHLFLFDPDIYFERREWNTPEKWARPENFRKFRW